MDKPSKDEIGLLIEDFGWHDLFVLHYKNLHWWGIDDNTDNGTQWKQIHQTVYDVLVKSMRVKLKEK